MSDLLAEVDEMMRRERMEKLWRDHGKLILGVIVLLVLATALVSGYREWNRSVFQAETAQIAALMEDDAFPANLEAASLDLRGGPKGVLLLTGAGAYVDQGKTAEALGLYQRVASDSAIPDSFRQLATLMAVRLQSADSENPDALLDMLTPLWQDSASPWRFHARLEAAVILADTKKDLYAAREHLSAVQDSQGLPDTLYQRARALDHVYALRQQQAPASDANAAPHTP